MAAPRTYHTEGVVLGHRRFGEADRLITVFTPNLGKLRLIARGARRPTSHLAGHLEVLSRSSLLVARSQSIDIVTQAQALESNAAVREDLQRASRAFYAAELMDRLYEDRAESYHAYRAFLGFLSWLVTASDLDLPLRHLELRLLDIAGYRPELYICLSCKARLAPETNALSGAVGGALCARCSAGDPEARPVSLSAQKVLRLLQKGDSHQVQRLVLEPGVSRELDLLMRGYLPFVVEREMRSTGFLDAVRGM